MSRKSLILLASLALAACLGPVDQQRLDEDGGPGADGGGSGADGGQDAGSGCTSDQQCPPGQVCDGCGASDRRCVMGCRRDDQCAPDFLCREVFCATCPCPSQCTEDGCVDKDGDGFVRSCDRKLCPGKLNCDCDDSDPAVNGRALESCNNGRDDDCNGLADKADPACQICSMPSPACTSSWDCQVGTESCMGGCCLHCPVPLPPPCGQGMCPVPNGIDPSSGCPNAPSCVTCCYCPGTYDPVCGLNGSTYSSPCEAACAQTAVLHKGACLPGEGMSCTGQAGSTSSCGPSGTMYCRDACPMCDMLMLRCTQAGVCVGDWDCPAGLKPPACPDGGVPSSKCVSQKCQYQCTR
ncbi:MAG: hypothetical protein HYZ28_24290 [Myxococcales bacterium]|nr:hypothetical protein [Myxococcales bacterium]